MRGFFASVSTGTCVLHNVLLDQYASTAHYPLMQTTTKTDRKIAALTAELTKRRAAGGTWADADVVALNDRINALCTEVAQ